MNSFHNISSLRIGDGVAHAEEIEGSALYSLVLLESEERASNKLRHDIFRNVLAVMTQAAFLQSFFKMFHGATFQFVANSFFYLCVARR